MKGNMKSLLNGIKSRIESEVGYLAGRVFIVPELYYGLELGFPCVAIKDGDFDNNLYSGVNDEDLVVDVAIFTEVLSGVDVAASVIGSGNFKGVLDIAEDVKNALKAARAIDGYGTMAILRDMASEPWRNEGGTEFTQVKVMTFNFAKD